MIGGERPRHPISNRRPATGFRRQTGHRVMCEVWIFCPTVEMSLQGLGLGVERAWASASIEFMVGQVPGSTGAKEAHGLNPKP